MLHWINKLQTLDRRWMYLATLLIVLIPILIRIPIPKIAVAPSSRTFYEHIESLPAGSVVLVDSSWDAGSLAENQAQLECVVRHLCQRRLKIVITSVGITALGPQFARDTIGPIAAEYDYEYGRDWVNCGFVQGIEGSIGAIIDGVCKDFRGTFPTDINGTPMDELPVMDGFYGVRDAELVYIVTYAPAPEWISFVKEQMGTPVAFGAMSIMAPQYINNYQAGQLIGLLLGNRGAAEYEQLTETPGQGQQLAVAGSFGALAVLIAAVLGNIAWIAGRRRGRG